MQTDLESAGTTSNTYRPNVDIFIPNSGSPTNSGNLVLESIPQRSSFGNTHGWMEDSRIIRPTISCRDQKLLRPFITDEYPAPSKNRFFTSFLGSSENTDEVKIHALHAILASLDDEPVEDGVTHSAETSLSEFLGKQGSSALLSGVFGTASHSGRIAGALQLLGRVPNVEVEMRKQLLRAGLKSARIGVRDAAVQAAALWEDTALLEILDQHHELTPWLADYIKCVAHELKN